jgi:hypothetical protein
LEAEQTRVEAERDKARQALEHPARDEKNESADVQSAYALLDALEDN